MLDFRLTNGGDDIMFSLPSNPTPQSNYTVGVGFTVSNVLISVDGVTSSYGVNFYSCGASCGGSPFLDLYIYNNTAVGLLYEAGPILFTGTDSQPVFKIGDFSLTDAIHSTPMRFESDFHLTISSDVAVPEPSGLSLMCIVIGAVAALRATRRIMPRRW
jgi:hypothetical protein